MPAGMRHHTVPGAPRGGGAPEGKEERAGSDSAGSDVDAAAEAAAEAAMSEQAISLSERAQTLGVFICSVCSVCSVCYTLLCAVWATHQF